MAGTCLLFRVIGTFSSRLGCEVAGTYLLTVSLAEVVGMAKIRLLRRLGCLGGLLLGASRQIARRQVAGTYLFPVARLLAAKWLAPTCSGR